MPYQKNMRYFFFSLRKPKTSDVEIVKNVVTRPTEESCSVTNANYSTCVNTPKCLRLHRRTLGRKQPAPTKAPKQAISPVAEGAA